MSISPSPFSESFPDVHRAPLSLLLLRIPERDFSRNSAFDCGTMVYPCLEVDEILRAIANELVGSGARATAAALARCCKSFEDPVLDSLWETQEQLLPLLKSFPGDVWKINEAGQFSFNRIPTKAEWSRFKKRARAMRLLIVRSHVDLIAADVLPTLQLRNGNDQFLPNMESFGCGRANEASIPLIPLLLPRQTAAIVIPFSTNVPAVMIASTIAQLPVFCPNLRRLVLLPLPRDPVIIEAASEMLLACNPDRLEEFVVQSPLTEEARRVLYNLPNLRNLQTVIQGPTQLPPLTLPSLTIIKLCYDDQHNWLQGFHGATFGKLLSVSFTATSTSEPIGAFLEDFKSAALTSSIQNTLSSFEFLTQRPWNPDYSSLLVFKQLKRLMIEFSCSTGCSSGVDDDVVISLAHAMPKLEVLYLGGQPCQATTGITLKGLVTLACCCPKLSNLRVHFRVRGLVGVVDEPEPPHLPAHATIIPETNCALTGLQVGQTPIRECDIFAVALTLVQIFPQINCLQPTGRRWGKVMETIGLIKRIGSRVNCHMAAATALRTSG